jgi:uncharacterized membrane protein YgcG
MASNGTSPTDQVMALYEQMETQAAQAGETLVGSRGFAGLLGQLAENTAALTKLGNDAMDLVLRNFRVAGRRDVVRLSRQLARTEDKLERVLQEVEDLRDELARERSHSGSSSGRAGNGTTARSRGGGRSGRAGAASGSASQDS